MKEANVIVKFFMNKNNMEYLLKGNIIENLDEIHLETFKNITKDNPMMIYEPRLNDPNHPNNKNLTHTKGNKSEYPDISDKIVAKAVNYIKGADNDSDALEIELVNSLYYFRLGQPVIKVNGYFNLSDTNNIHLNSITRLTLADKNS